MALTTRFGRPDMFITFTYNPKWREITENLLPSEKAVDRPDLVTRVFYLKLEAFKKDILKDHILGKYDSTPFRSGNDPPPPIALKGTSARVVSVGDSP